jgi:GTP cyclohydrolase FolE2
MTMRQAEGSESSFVSAAEPDSADSHRNPVRALSQPRSASQTPLCAQHSESVSSPTTSAVNVTVTVAADPPSSADMEALLTRIKRQIATSKSLERDRKRQFHSQRMYTQDVRRWTQKQFCEIEDEQELWMGAASATGAQARRERLEAEFVSMSLASWRLAWPRAC